MPDQWFEIFGWHKRHEDRIENIERKLSEIMANVQDLNNAIANLPQKIADVVIPLIPVSGTGTGTGEGPTGDTTPQIEALALVPSQVASMVSAALAAQTPPPVPSGDASTSKTSK